jgi:hypothetical protein
MGFNGSIPMIGVEQVKYVDPEDSLLVLYLLLAITIMDYFGICI